MVERLDELSILKAVKGTFMMNPLCFSMCLMVLVSLYMLWRYLQNNVYLIDFGIYEGNEEFNVTRDGFMGYSRNVRSFTQESIDFQQRITVTSGLGNTTNFPSHLTEIIPRANIETSREEFGVTVLKTIEILFSNAGIKAQDIDILILNCSLFNPTPSLSELVINHFKMRSDIIYYNLAGMGCSAGVISLDLAKDLMKVHKNSLCLVVSTENVTQNWYWGNDKVSPEGGAHTLSPYCCLFKMFPSII